MGGPISRFSNSDRSAAAAAFVAAVGGLLAEQSFSALNVEALARRAGFNKALVYRYFGGLEGVVAAYAASDDFLPGTDELSEGVPKDGSGWSPRQVLAQVLKNYAQSLRRRPASVQILLHGAACGGVITEALEQGRRRRIQGIRDDLGITDQSVGLDMDVVMALFLSAFLMLVAHEQRVNAVLDSPGGLPFWQRMEATIDSLMGCYPPG